MLYVLGGYHNTAEVTSDCYACDLLTYVHIPVTSLPFPLYSATALSVPRVWLLENGCETIADVVRIPRMDTDDVLLLQTTRLLRFTNNTWQEYSHLSDAVTKPAIGVCNEHIFIMGGSETGISCLCYDIHDCTQTVLPDMHAPSNDGIVVVNDRGIFAVTGNGCVHHLETMKVHGLGKSRVIKRWVLLRTAPEPRNGASYVSYSDRVLMIGGEHSGKVDEYNISTDIWTRLRHLPKPLSSCAAACVDGYIYVAGGIEPCATVLDASHDEKATTSAYRYDVHKNQWTPIADMPSARSHAVAVSWNGKLLVMGGRDIDGVDTASVISYDPNMGVWESVSDMPYACCPDGAVTAARALFDDKLI